MRSVLLSDTVHTDSFTANNPDTVYYQVNGEMVRDAALRTKGSGRESQV